MIDFSAIFELYYFLVYGVISCPIWLCFYGNDPSLFFDYKPIILSLYDRTNMNIFGCLVVSILLLLLFPWLFIMSELVKLIYWICHIGRKDK